MKNLRLIPTLFFIASILVFTSCNDDDISIPEGKGHLNIHLTDSPFPIELISSTNVTIDKIEVRKKMEESMNAENDSFIVLSDQAINIDLLELSNGITEQIATNDLNIGYYDMIRLHVVDAKVTLTDDTEFDLDVPSGSTSGIKVKIDPEIYVEEGQTYDVLLDFDVSRSFVAKGNINGIINGFNFKPVVRGVFLGASGRIEGNVVDTAGVTLENAMVKAWSSEYNEDNLESNDDYINIVSSFTGQDGQYKLIGLPEGEYTVMCAMEGYKNDTVKNVSVMAENVTELDFNLEEE